jgi:hypothetical protein
MMIEDTFSYSDRWDGFDIDCSACTHEANGDHWPNTERDNKCGLHNVPLRIELRESGYKEGEWFCRDFENNGKAYPKAMKELESMRTLLQVRVLYGCYGQNHLLKEVPFEKLEEYN